MGVRFRAAGLALMALTLMASLPAVAQTPARKAPAGKWEQPKTPWGDPDLGGIWNNVTATPLQRPENQDKALLTDEEAREAERQAIQRRDANEATPVAQQSAGARTGYSPSIWFETTQALSQGRTSLLVEPSNGRLPDLTAEARKAQLAEVAARKVAPADKPEDRGPYERCITRGMPGAMMPGFYNHNYHILQTPGYVVIQVEMVHDSRIIPMDGRPHVGSQIKQWLGDSRGRWEGNTLVVETTNMRNVEQRNVAVFGTSEKGKVIERFTRLSADSMEYTITVDDPPTYTKSWTASLPMTKVPGPLYEYACHEGNYGLPNILAGHRLEEREAAAKQAK